MIKACPRYNSSIYDGAVRCMDRLIPGTRILSLQCFHGNDRTQGETWKKVSKYAGRNAGSGITLQRWWSRRLRISPYWPLLQEDSSHGPVMITGTRKTSRACFGAPRQVKNRDERRHAKITFSHRPPSTEQTPTLQERRTCRVRNLQVVEENGTWPNGMTAEGFEGYWDHR